MSEVWDTWKTFETDPDGHPEGYILASEYNLACEHKHKAQARVKELEGALKEITELPCAFDLWPRIEAVEIAEKALTTKTQAKQDGGG